MAQLIVPIGLPASGKSTYRAQWLAEDPDGRIAVSYDDLRLGMFGPDWVWNRREEEQMKKQARMIVQKALMAGLSVIVDNTNLSRRVRSSWQDLGRDVGAEYIEVDVSTPLAECIRRDRQRGDKRVGQAVIDEMALRYGYLDFSSCSCAAQEPSSTLDFHLHKAADGSWHRRWCYGTQPIVIVDIDSTVSNCDARLHHIQLSCTQCNEPWEDDFSRPLVGNCIVTGQPHIKSKKNWPAYFSEEPNDPPIAGTIRLINLLSQDHLIVFVSGRLISMGNRKTGILTEDWLFSHNVPFDRLFLKRGDDHRRAVEHKKDILGFLPKARVAYVFDDDPSCVEMYQAELRGAGTVILQPTREG